MFDSFLPQPLSLQQYLLRTAAALLIIGLHSFSLALTARLLGDRGVAWDERFTPNPFTHLDLIGLLGLIFYRQGFSKPMRIDHEELKGGRFGLVLCVLAAVLTSIAAGLLLQLLKPLATTLVGGNAGLTIQAFLSTFGRMSIWFALLNLLPLPPFTGGHFLVAAFPGLAERLEGLRVPAVILGALIIVSGAGTALFRPAYTFIASLGIGL